MDGPWQRGGECRAPLLYPRAVLSIASDRYALFASMTSTTTDSETTASVPPSDERSAAEDGRRGRTLDQIVPEARAELKSEIEARRRLDSALGPLTKESVYLDLAKLEAKIRDVREKVEEIDDDETRGRGMELLDALEGERAARLAELRERLASDLKAACDDRGLAIKVLSKEEPIRLRIPPFAVEIERDKGRATIAFAEETLAECSADAHSILKAHREAVAALGEPFDGAAFFEAALRAWKAAVATGEGGATQRVEMSAYLPHLVLQMQSPAFRAKPSAAAFVEYGRAHFAYDVMRARRQRLLVHDGWRLNLGVATGTTASQKNKVIWFEDEHGNGEYKLTVFFTRIGSDESQRATKDSDEQ